MEETAGKRNNRSHYRVFNGKLIPKTNYETEEQAVTMAIWLNTMSKTLHQMVAYKCSKCNKWHLGSTSKILTEELRENYKERIKKRKKLTFAK